MSKSPAKKLTAWSYSRHSAYIQCPYKVKLTALDKLREPKGEAMLRGIRIHQLSEDYVKGKLTRLPSELASLDKQFKEMRRGFVAGTVFVEEQLAFNRDWEPSEYFDKETWVRIKKDLVQLRDDGVVRIVDVKTGKIRDGYEEQLELYAAVVPLLYDEVSTVEVQLWYVDHGEVRGAHHEEEGSTVGIYTVDECNALRKDWERRVKPMMADTKFKPKPSWLCRYCHFRKENNGPCKF